MISSADDSWTPGAKIIILEILLKTNINFSKKDYINAMFPMLTIIFLEQSRVLQNENVKISTKKSLQLVQMIKL